MLKSISLPKSAWKSIIEKLEGEGSTEAKDCAAMIEEQLNGSVTIKTVRGGGYIAKAPKGGDLRGMLGL
ncbi:MAG: hypothetical protein ACRCVX_03890 [Shewanella sp.]